MAIYEVLIRGNRDGTLSGAHTIEWVPDGTNADGNPRFRVGDPKPITEEALTTYVGSQYAAAAAQIIALIKERDDLALKLREQPFPQHPIETIRTAWLKAALAQIGKLADVNAAVTDPVFKALWDSATEIRRNDPDVIAVAAALAIDLDDLWARARAIRAARSGS